jgi:hypothetical protein
MIPVGLSDIPDGQSFDVIVVGAGAAGMSAALFAAISGLKPLLIEHTDRVGGTSAYSAGSAWIPNTRHAVLVDADDSLEKAALYLRHSVGNESPESMRMAFLSSGPDAVASLEQKSQVQFRARQLHPDYNSNLPGSTLKGRVLEAAPFDGRALGSMFGLVREPIPEFTVLGGMMVNQEDVLNFLSAGCSWRAFRHSAGLLARERESLIRYGCAGRRHAAISLPRRLHFSDWRLQPASAIAVQDAAPARGGILPRRTGAHRRTSRIAVRVGRALWR